MKELRFAWTAVLALLALTACPGGDAAEEGPGSDGSGVSSSKPAAEISADEKPDAEELGGNAGSGSGGDDGGSAAAGDEPLPGGDDGGAEAGASAEAGAGGASGEAGSGGTEPDKSACDDVPLDKQVSEFTEAEAAANCRCGQERMPDVDWLRFQCTVGAAWAAASPAECEAMVASCMEGEVTCEGAQQLAFIDKCTGTIPELEDCFLQATEWQIDWTCAIAGPDNEARRGEGAPQCLSDSCGAMF